MPEPGQAPTVESQLAEMDRRLSELQAELAPQVNQAAEAQGTEAPADSEFAADSEPAAEAAHREESKPAAEAAPAVESEVAASQAAAPAPEPEPIRQPPPQTRPAAPQPPPAAPQPPPAAPHPPPAAPKPPPAAPEPPAAPPQPPPAAPQSPPASPQPPPAPPQPPPVAPQPPPVAPQPPPVGARYADEARGRAGPLSTLLQRSSRRDVSAQQVETSRRDVSTQEVETLAVLSERLLASLRELLAGYELVVAQMRTEGAPPSRSSLGAQAPRAHAAHPQEFTLSAGPFHTTIALREFQRAITTLPGVREVAVREYEGADRAILHVQLDEGTA